MFLFFYFLSENVYSFLFYLLGLHGRGSELLPQRITTVWSWGKIWGHEWWNMKLTGGSAVMRTFDVTFTYCHKEWDRIQVAKISFVCSMTGLTLRDSIQSSGIHRGLGEESLHLHVKRSFTCDWFLPSSSLCGLHWALPSPLWSSCITPALPTPLLFLSTLNQHPLPLSLSIRSDHYVHSTCAAHFISLHLSLWSVMFTVSIIWWQGKSSVAHFFLLEKITLGKMCIFIHNYTACCCI